MNSNHYPLILSGLTFERFMFAPDAEGCLETTVEEKTPQQYLFTLRSHEASRGKWIQHCQLKICFPSAVDLSDCKALDKLDMENITQRCDVTLPGDDFYIKASECGFQLGPTFRGVQTVAVSEDFQEGLLYAEAPLSVKREFHRYVYHPAFMDSFLQSFAVLLFKASEVANQLSGKATQAVYRVPKGIEKFSLLGPTPTRLFIHLKVSEKDRSICDIDLANAKTKEIFCKVRGLIFETIQTDTFEPQVWSTSWDNLGSLQITEGPRTLSTTLKNVVFFPDKSEVSALFTDFLVKEKHFNVVVIDTENGDAVQQAVDVVSENQKSDTLLVTMKTDHVGISLNSGMALSRSKFEDYQDKGPLFCYSVLKALQLSGFQARLLIFTKGGQHAREGDIVNPFIATLNTCGMTVSHEEPSIRCFSVDLPLAADNMECAQISREIIYEEDRFFHDENMLAVRSSILKDKEQQVPTWEFLSPRLKMADISKAPGVVPTSDWLVSGENVSDGNHVFVQKNRSREGEGVGRGTVRVKVEAFTIYGRQNTEGETRFYPSTCVYAGKAERTSGSKQVCETYLGLTACDKVLTHMTSSSDDLTKIPPHLTCKEAVGIVSGYFSGAVFFKQTVSVSAGMRLMVKLDHFDRSVIQTVNLAANLGAKTIVLQGDVGEMDLRNPDIAVMRLGEVTNSSVDVLFLSTRSPALDGILLSLLPKLRTNATVVIVKRQNQETRVKLLPSNMKLVVFNSDLPSVLDGLSRADISKTLSDLWEMFDPKVARNLTSKFRNSTDLSSLAARDTEMSVGEVIEVGKEELLLPPSLVNDGFVADQHCSYFITGGTRGFGLRLLEWLVLRGARYIYTGSRGEISDELESAIQRAETVGAQIQHIQLDVANAADVERGLVRMKAGKWPALKGIFHCAAVFSDAFLQNINAESWDSVVAPKAYGALLLHQLTLKLGIQLDHFIMTSSIVSLMGNAGQGSYCAANVFLNALAQYRHSMGLPATAVQIGVISDVGFAMRRGLIQMWEQNGVGSMSPEEVLGSIGCALSARQPQFGISGSFNRKVYASKHPGLMMQHFREKHGTVSLMKVLFPDRDLHLSKTNDTLIQTIVRLPLAKARELVVETLARLFGQQLGLSDEVPYDASPISLGLDSLMASEASQMIRQHFEVTVGAVDLLNDKNTMHVLSKNITRQMLEKGESTSPVGFENGESSAPKKKVIVEGEAPDSIVVKLVCFPSNGAGPSLFASWIQILLQFGVQLLMVQLPGWEGREDEQQLQNMSDIARIIYDELSPHVSGSPFVFFGHSMGSLIAFEVAHLLLKEDSMCPRHFFVSAWYAPTAPYPHPEELKVKTATFEKLKKTLENQPKLFADLTEAENVTFSFLDKGTLANAALMRRLIPCIEAAIGMLRRYTCKYQTPLPCNITALGGKQDEFVTPELLDGWELLKSKKNTFRKMTFPGKHMFILTNTPEIVKLVCFACKKCGQ